MQIFSLLGRKRSGKDTAAKIIHESLDCNDNKVKYMSFAEPIKDALIDLTGAPLEFFYEQQFKEQPLIIFGSRKFTPRELMVWYGNLMRDKFGNNFWVDKVKKKIQQLGDTVDYLFITDVRFLEETIMLDSIGSKIIYMDRDAILDPIPKDADISEKIVYESRAWARENAKDYVEISNHNNSIGYLTMHIRSSLKI